MGCENLRLERIATRYRCGHIFGDCDIVRLVDCDCYNCDPDEFHLRIIADLAIMGMEMTPDLDSKLQELQFRKFHVG
jgi:hypothetical protein